MKVSHLVSALVLSIGVSATAEAASISFNFTTTGCFTDTSCTPTLASDSSDGLSFTNVSNVSAIVDTGGDFEDVSLGSFAIPALPGSSDNVQPEDFFVLRISFSQPLNAGSMDSTATILGQITGGPNNNVTVDFSQVPINFTFSDAGGPGSFQLLILNDPNLVRSTTSGVTVGLSGRIQNVAYDPTFPDATVPEPGSMLLLGTGLAGLVAYRMRRKRS